MIMVEGHREGIYQYRPGYKSYELANYLEHRFRTGLGYVLNVLSNVKYYDPNNEDYISNVFTDTHYFPFGMSISDELLEGNYRYSFQGQEADNEIKGAGNNGTNNNISLQSEGEPVGENNVKKP